MATVTPRLLSADEFAESAGDRKHVELVRGEVAKSLPPGGVHGRIAHRLSLKLGLWAEGTRAYVGVESGYLLSRDPDTVRGPDVSYVRADRIPPEGVPTGFWTLAPDLAVEVVRPHETADDVLDKVDQSLSWGVARVWVVYPERKCVVVHEPDGLSRRLTVADTLEGDRLLPGFSLPLTTLFAEC